MNMAKKIEENEKVITVDEALKFLDSLKAEISARPTNNRDYTIELEENINVVAR